MTFIAQDLAVTTNPDGNRLQTIASRLRKHLQKIAGRRVPTTYQELAKALALTPPPPGGSDALPAMRQDSSRGLSMRWSSTPRSGSGRQRQPMARAAWWIWGIGHIYFLISLRNRLIVQRNGSAPTSLSSAARG